MGEHLWNISVHGGGGMKVNLRTCVCVCVDRYLAKERVKWRDILKSQGAKQAEVFWLDEQLLACQEVLRSVEIITAS
jgi:hypothetical protein